jgi:protein transport protein SEC61 subunit alpha
VSFLGVWGCRCCLLLGSVDILMASTLPLPPPPPQLEPKDLSEQLKRTGAAIPGIRPGKQTAEYVTSTLTRMSILGSVFLGALSAAPAAVEAITHLSAFRGFAGTSVLIMVGVATDTARRIRAEQAMSKYLTDQDKAYDEIKY